MTSENNKGSTPSSSSKKKKKPVKPPSGGGPATPSMMLLDSSSTPTKQSSGSGITGGKMLEPTQQKVSDLCVTLHKCVHDWENVNTASFQTVNTLISLHSQLSACPTTHQQFSNECLQALKVSLPYFG